MADADPPANRSAASRRRLIAAAERLFAQHGFSAVSLRQIGAAAGQRNTNAVRYHFGAKERLIEAIFERRQAELEPIRRDLLASVPDDDSTPAGVEALLAVIVRPPLMIADADERYDYVKLLAAYLNRERDSGMRHPLDYAPHLLPALIEAHERLFRALPLPRAIFDLRIQMIVGMSLQAVIQRRIRLDAGLASPPEEVLIREMMTMAGAAMRAPSGYSDTGMIFPD